MQPPNLPLPSGMPTYVTLAAVMIGALPVSTLAAEESAQGPQGLEEVVVTAQKRSENLQRVPIAVSVVSREQLETSGVTNTLDLPTVVSGLTMVQSSGAISPFVRGVGSTVFGPGIESPVVLFIDDVYYASTVTNRVDMTDMSQVNVLKGPQGTLFGRNATGGVIQMTSRDPTDELGIQMKSEFDNYETSRNNVYLTGGLTDNLKANVSLSYAHQGEGWGKNLTTGNEIRRIFHDVSGRSKWVFTPGSSTTIKLVMDYTDRLGNNGPNFGPAPGTTPQREGYRHTGNPWDSDNIIDNRLELKAGGASLNVSQELGFGRLVNIVAYRDTEFSSQHDSGLSGPVPSRTSYFSQKGEQFSEELQLLSPQNEKLNWMVGFYYFHSDDSVPYVRLNSFGPYVGARNITTRIVEGSGTTNSKAIFGQATARVGAATNLTAGVRYTEDHRQADGRESIIFASTPPAVPGPFSNQSKDFSKATWRLALDHNFTPDVLGYMSYNRGFKAGGFNVFNPGTPAYQPETLDAYEVGLKTELFDNRVRVNTAAFDYLYKNIQVIRFGVVPTVVNAPEAEVYGVDIDVEAKVFDAVSIRGGMEWLHPTFTDYANAQLTVPAPNGLGSVSVDGSAEGNTLPLASEWTASIGADYLMMLNSGAIKYNVTTSYNSGFYTEPDNFLHQDNWLWLNAGITWTSSDNAWSVGVWGRNLLDKAVASQLNAVAPRGYDVDYNNPPRTFGVTANYRFGSQR